MKRKPIFLFIMTAVMMALSCLYMSEGKTDMAIWQLLMILAMNTYRGGE